MADETPSQEQLKEAWLEHLERQKTKAPANSDNQDPQQAQRNLITEKPQQSYKEMRQEWNKRRGILHHDATFDTGMSTEDVEKYHKLKNEWYSRQGKRSPEAMHKKWDQRLENDQDKYNNW